MRNHNKCPSIGLLIIVLTIIKLLFVTIVVVSILQVRGKNERISGYSFDEGIFLKYTIVNSLTNQTNRGTFLSRENMSIGKSIENPVGVQTLISRFSDEEYICTGSCFCDDRKKDGVFGRRKSSSSAYPLVSGLLILVSALSSVVALDMAKEYYNEECEDGLEDCPKDSIRSEVDDCKPIENFEPSGKYGGEPETETTQYDCTGRCSPLDFATRSHYLKDILSDEKFWEEFEKYYVDLGELSIEERTVILKFGLEKIYDTTFDFCQKMQSSSTVVVDRIGSFDIQEVYARNTFSSIHLRKFCLSNSVMSKEKLLELYNEKALATSSDSDNNANIGGDDLFDSYYFPYLLDVFLEKSSNDKDELSVCTGVKDTQIKYMHYTRVSVVCLRVFTDKEWEKGIPYEHNNLRHWKKGYKQTLDDSFHSKSPLKKKRGDQDF